MGIKKIIKNILTYPTLPDFLILGAQKAGTTSLDSYLKYHPNLKGTHPKEIHFFDNQKNYTKGLKWYQNHFRRFYFDKKTLFFESAPNYIFNENLPQKLKKLNPDLKFIIILRDPVKRAFSAYNMFKINYEDQKKNGQDIQEHLLCYIENGAFMSFERVVQQELEMIEKGVANSEFDESFTFLRKGLYKQQLQNWQQHFPKENFLILDFEDLKKDEIAMLNKICSFLNISDFTNIKIDKEPRNKREYQDKILPETEQILKNFFIQNQ